MPKNNTTWKKGEGGKPKGAKDLIPRSFKATLLSVYEKVCSDEPELIERAVMSGLRSRRPKEAFPFVKLYAELRGELKQVLQFQDAPPLLVVDQLTAEDIAQLKRERAE
jgi:hypothetical protein